MHKANIQKKKHCLGKSAMMNCGKIATIIEYRNSLDIDVQFEDGTIVPNRQYTHFKNGSIRHPDFTSEHQTLKRIGEKKMMNCGLEAEIIKYFEANNITVKFSDGTIVKNRRYYHFQNGLIKHPEIKNSASTSRNEFGIYYYLKDLGFKKIERGEFEKLGFGFMELDLYNDKLKIAIEYDGAIHQKNGGLERDLKKNKICKENGIRIYRIREKELDAIKDNISRNFILKESGGTKVLTSELTNIVKTILKELELPYYNVDFERDKDKILKLYHEKFYNIHERTRQGMRLKMNCGMYATIIKYYDSCNITVQFDDGTIIKNRIYKDFIKGEIAHPDFKKFTSRIGEKNIMKSGLEATIAAYRNTHDIDVIFKDGAVAKHKSYNAFQRGKIAHPSCAKLKSSKSKVGEKREMKCGLIATIITYRKYNDIDIQFEDGIIVTNKRYDHFKEGYISHPSQKLYNKKVA